MSKVAGFIYQGEFADLAVHNVPVLNSFGAVSSSNKMPAAVKQSVRSAAETHGKLSEDEANDFITKMESEGRLIEECWS